MNRKQNSRKVKRSVRKGRDPVAEYLAALEKVYPAAIGTAEAIRRQNDMVVVCVPLPKRVNERMRLFDQMAEVGTKILIETDQLIILSSQ